MSKSPVVAKSPRMPEFVYTFDINRRIYAETEDGSRWFGSPIYRGHWRPMTVTGQTKQSWLIKEYPKRISKKKAKFLWEVNDDCWINSHRIYIAEMVADCRDADILRAVATLIGFKENLTP